MPQASVLRESVSFTPSQLIELWTVNGAAIGLDTIYRFVNSSSCNFQPVTLAGVQYTPFPIMVEGMEVDGKTSLPRPRLTVSNINGFTSALLLQNAQMVGATVTRQRIFARFLDATNFPANQPLPSWVTPDPTATFPPEPFLVNRKITENQRIVSWELASPLDFQQAKLPRRQIIANICTWKYRQTGTCNYTGAPVSDAANRTFTGTTYGMTLVDKGTYSAGTTYARGDYVQVYSDLPQYAAIPTVWVCTTAATVGVTPGLNIPQWVADTCTKGAAACKQRFSGGVPLRTSAFPGVSRGDWISRA